MLWVLLPLLLRFRFSAMKTEWAVSDFFPLWQRLGSYLQDVLVWCIAFAVLMPRLRPGRPARRAWAVFTVVTCNIILFIDILDLQCKMALMQPLTFGLLVGSLREARRLSSSLAVFATPRLAWRSTLSFVALDASPLLAVLWGRLSRSLPRRVSGLEIAKAASRATLGAIPILVILAFFLPPQPYQLDGNVLTSWLISDLRRFRAPDVADLADTCDEPARLLGKDDLASGRDPEGAIARGRNVVLFIVETLPYGESSLGDPASDRTPLLRELAQYGPITSRARAQVPYSTKAIYSILTGRYASPTLEVFESEIPRLDSLPRTLHDAGYATAFFSTQFLSWHNVGRQYEAMGFDQVVGADRLKASAAAEGRTLQENSWGVDDREFLASGVVDTLPTDRPFFAVFYNTASHNPYVYDSQERTGTDLERFRRALRYGDDALRGVVDAFRRRGQFDDTVFVVLGDHGEDFIDGKLKVRGCFLSERSVVVPLVIALPGAKAEHAATAGARQIDLVPTLLDLLGIESRVPVQGRSLLAGPPSTPPAYLNGYGACDVSGLVDGATKRIYDGYTGRAESFFVDRDPEELEPGAVLGADKDALITRLRACSQYDERALRSLALE
jgi:arylsulfatase A-like enzyme